MAALSVSLSQVDQVVRLRDKFAGNADDLVWIPGLAEDGPWAVISRDRFKKQGGAERAALRAAGHTVFFLERQWERQTFWLQAERLVRWWPHVVQQANMVEQGAFRVPWQQRGKFIAVKL